MSRLTIPRDQRRGFEVGLWSATALLTGGLGACGQRHDPSAAAVQPAGSEEASYLAPPRATSVQVGPGGALMVSGLAPPRSTVEITSPEGERARVLADRRGAWGAQLMAAAQPRLYAISASLAGRTVHAEGALITAPGAVTPAVTVRAGYAAFPLGSDRQSGTASPGLSASGISASGIASPGIASVDYDPSGFIAVAGSAPPHAQLTLVVDGTAAAVGQADAEGRYALLAANRRLTMGAHRLQVRAPDGVRDRQVTLEPPVALTTAYQAWPGPNGWRVEWALNGGGFQTTLILDR